MDIGNNNGQNTPSPSPTHPQQPSPSPTQEQPQQVPAPAGQAAQPPTPGAAEPKSFLAAILFSSLLGIFGVDRFYLGYKDLGILKLVTLGGCGIWALIDEILILAGVLKSKDGQPLAEREKYLVPGIVIVVALWTFSLLLNVLFLLA